MNFLSRRKARTLLQNAKDTRLTPSEQQLLQTYLQTDEGRIYAKLNQQLTESQPEMDEEHLDYQHLRQAARKINQEVQRKRRTRRKLQVGQTVVGITAVFALIIIGIGWLQTRRQVTLEPMLSQAVIVPTLTPPAGMAPVDLRSVTPYYSTRTVAIAEEAAGFTLHLPTWLAKNMAIKAVDYYPEENSVELLTAQKKGSEMMGPYWILSQAKLSTDPVKKPLRTVFNPFSPYSYKIMNATQEEISIDGKPATFEQEFWTTSGGIYGYFVSRVSWETDKKRFFLTIMDSQKYTEASTMLEFLTNMRLEETAPAQ